MRRTTLLSGLAAIAMLAAFANTPAEAQRVGAPNISPTINHVRIAPHLRLRAEPHQSRDASTLATIHAVSVYLQWRKCLDNMLPQCP